MEGGGVRRGLKAMVRRVFLAGSLFDWRIDRHDRAFLLPWRSIRMDVMIFDEL